MNYKVLFIIVFGFFLIISSCDRGNPVSVATPEFGAEQVESDALCKPRPGIVTIMTRNVYVGADVDRILAAQTLDEIPVLAMEEFLMLGETNFQERAQSLAREIKLTRPHLIGLQEISWIRVQEESDYIPGETNPPNADIDVYNYLNILMQTLADKGLSYYVAGSVENFDVEVPMVVGMDGEIPILSDVRLTDYDVVLARADVNVSNVESGNYVARLIDPAKGLEIKRGYVALDARVGKKTFHFVNTHLEALPSDPTDPLYPFSLQIQMWQAEELSGILSGITKPILLVGDFNSPAPQGDTYEAILLAGFEDLWNYNHVGLNPDGFTFGHDLDLRNQYVDFYERIDFVFAKNFSTPTNDALGPVWAIVVGDEYQNRTVTGMWPSDHGGVVARMVVPQYDIQQIEQLEEN